MPRLRHHTPTSRASIVRAVLGIVIIAVGVFALVPVGMNWPASWPGVFVTPMLMIVGARLVARHIAGHHAMTRDKAVAFAHAWADAWNSRDAERVLAFFHDDCVFTSPTALAVVGVATVRGKPALRAYWSKALERIQSLHFKIDRVLWDAEARELAIIYTSNSDGRNKRVSENLTFGSDGRVASAEVFHGVE
jgi:hypothetical protein